MGAAVVDLGDGREQRRDRSASASAQQLSLGGRAYTDEPAAQAGPALLPANLGGREPLRGRLEGIGKFAAGRSCESEIHSG